MDDQKQAENFEFNLFKWNLTKLTTTSLAVKRSMSLVVKRSTSLVVKRSTSLTVKQSMDLASIQRLIP